MADQPVGTPAHRFGHPDHLDAVEGGQGEGNQNPQAQVGQIGDGEQLHIPGTPQHAVHGHLEADDADEEAHEFQERGTGFQGHGRSPVTQEEPDDGLVAGFQHHQDDYRIQHHQFVGGMVTGKDPVHFSGAQVLACVGTHGIADGHNGLLQNGRQGDGRHFAQLGLAEIPGSPAQLTDQVHEHPVGQHRRKPLADQGGPGGPGHTPAQVPYHVDVQEHVEQGGENQEIQGIPGFA